MLLILDSISPTDALAALLSLYVASESQNQQKIKTAKCKVILSSTENCDCSNVLKVSYIDQTEEKKSVVVLGRGYDIHSSIKQQHWRNSLTCWEVHLFSLLLRVR